MPEEIPSLYPEPSAIKKPPGRGALGYYRKRNGWIVTGPTTASNRADFEYMGHRFLPQYGEFPPDTADPRATPRGTDDKGNPWNSAVEPWRLILQRDGAKEFPVDQVIAYRWHIRPPYREVSFPQLEGVEIANFFCPECEKGIFSSTNKLEAIAQLKAHLTSKSNGQHEYRPEDLRALGHELGINFDTARIGRMEKIKAQAAENPPEPSEIIRCKCSWEPKEGTEKPVQALAMHQRMHCPLRKKEPIAAAS